MTGQTRMWTNHAGGYFTCSHRGCAKKVVASITDHDCCGRCAGARDCHNKAAANYSGPGTFYHRYHEGIVAPGVCMTCKEGRESH